MIQGHLKISRGILDSNEIKDSCYGPGTIMNDSLVFTKVTFCFVSLSQKNIHIR